MFGGGVVQEFGAFDGLRILAEPGNLAGNFPGEGKFLQDCAQELQFGGIREIQESGGRGF